MAKKNEVKNRKAKLKTLITFSTIFILIGAALLAFVYFGPKDQYATYSEESKATYEVGLIEDGLFDEEFSDSNKKYIASLVDDISVNFNYKMTLDRNVEYTYSYKIVLSVDVSEKDSSYSLFNKTEVVKQSEVMTANSKEISITEDTLIEYAQYNQTITQFMDAYKLDSFKANLKLSMYVSVVASSADFEQELKQDHVISVATPLAAKTIAIDVVGNNKNSNGASQIKLKTPELKYKQYYLYGSAASLFLGVLFALIAIGYESKSRTPKVVYDKEINKIARNYGGYVQTVKADVNLDNYQVIMLSSFDDLLDIRDTVRQPILYKESEEGDKATFVVINNDLAYKYCVEVLKDEETPVIEEEKQEVSNENPETVEQTPVAEEVVEETATEEGSEEAPVENPTEAAADEEKSSENEDEVKTVKVVDYDKIFKIILKDNNK